MYFDSPNREPIWFGNLSIDAKNRLVTASGAEIRLTSSEFLLLQTLVSNVGSAISKQALLSAMWGGDWQADTTSLQVHVSRLRKKLEEHGVDPNHIQTVHGYGYRFVAIPANNHIDAATSDALDEAVGLSLNSNLPSADVVVGLDRIIQWADPRIAELLGCDPDALVGMQLYDLLHPGDRERGISARMRLDAGNPVTLEVSMNTTGGNYRQVRAEVRPIKGPDSTTVAFIGHLQALTPNSSSSHNSSETTSQGRTVALTYDKDFILRDVTPNEPFAGWRPEDVLNTFFSPTGADKPTVMNVVKFMLSQGQVEVENTITGHNAEGDEATFATKSRIITDLDGNFNGVVGIIYLD